MRNTAFFEEIYQKPKSVVWYKDQMFWATVIMFAGLLLAIIY